MDTIIRGIMYVNLGDKIIRYRDDMFDVIKRNNRTCANKIINKIAMFKKKKLIDIINVDKNSGLRGEDMAIELIKYLRTTKNEIYEYKNKKYIIDMMITYLVNDCTVDMLETYRYFYGKEVIEKNLISIIKCIINNNNCGLIHHVYKKYVNIDNKYKILKKLCPYYTVDTIGIYCKIFNVRKIDITDILVKLCVKYQFHVMCWIISYFKYSPAEIEKIIEAINLYYVCEHYYGRMCFIIGAHY